MSPPWALGVHGSGWLQLLIGLGAIGALGTGLAWRILPQDRMRWLLSPVLALSALPLSQILLATFLGVPVTPVTTYALLAALTLWAWAPRLQAIARPRLERPRRRTVLTALALLAAFGFVALVHGLVHIPGAPADGPLDVYPELAQRGLQGLQGDDYPYPVHVDEHIHIAQTMQLQRDQDLALTDPYFGTARDTGLFSISGLRSERGFELMTLQVTDITGLSISALYRFAPALWAGYIGLLLWASTRPAPGAIAGMALIAASPTTPRLLGLGLLIPSTFAVAWIPAIVWITLQGRGGGRFAGLLLLITGAFFMHTVLGVLAILAGLVAIFALPGTWRRKAGLSVAVFLPLVWILPILWRDAAVAVAGESNLPFTLDALRTMGPLLPVAAGAGILAAWFHWAGVERVSRPHRAYSMLGVGLALSMAISVLVDHRSEATYARIAFTAYLCLAAVAGLAIGTLARKVGRRVRRAESAPAMAALLVLFLLAWPVHASLAAPFYRVWDEDTWDAHPVLAAEVGPGDRFLSHPWRAPLYSGFTGATPHAVLYPGNPPVGQADWDTHFDGGHPATWYRDEGIDAVVGKAPTGESDAVGASVYRVV